MPVRIEPTGEKRTAALALARPSPRALMAIGEAFYNMVLAFDMMFRSLGIPTAFSLIEREPLRIETSEFQCQKCGETIVVDRTLLVNTRFCSYCGTRMEAQDAEKAD